MFDEEAELAFAAAAFVIIVAEKVEEALDGFEVVFHTFGGVGPADLDHHGAVVFAESGTVDLGEGGAGEGFLVEGGKGF